MTAENLEAFLMMKELGTSGTKSSSEISLKAGL